MINEQTNLIRSVRPLLEEIVINMNIAEFEHKIYMQDEEKTCGDGSRILKMKFRRRTRKVFIFYFYVEKRKGIIVDMDT